MKHIVTLIVLALTCPISNGALLAMECKTEGAAQRLKLKPRKFKFGTAEVKADQIYKAKVAAAQKLSPESCSVLHEALKMHGMDMGAVKMNRNAELDRELFSQKVANITSDQATALLNMVKAMSDDEDSAVCVELTTYLTSFKK